MITYQMPGGRERTAKRTFYIHQHPGGGSASDIPPDMEQAMGRATAARAAKQAGNGDWIMYADGRLHVGRHPVRIEGSADEGGFQFGDLDAQIGILNESYAARRSFVVENNGGHPVHGTEWITRVDGRTVEAGEFHPFYIAWDAGDSGHSGVSL